MAKSYFYDESIADWRELVKGEQGERGPQGPIGPQGPAIDIETGLPISVDTTVGTRVFIGDTMIYGDTGWRILSDELINGWTGRILYRVGQEGDRPYVEFYASDSSPLDGRNATADEFLIINDLRADGYFHGNYDTAGRLDAYHSSSRHVVFFSYTGERYLTIATGNRYTGSFRYPLLRWPETVRGTPR